MRKLMLAAAATAALATTPAMANIDTYVAFLYGANEVGGGDTDGFGVATVLIDDVASTVSWSILALNIDMPLTGAHIHAAPAGVNGGVIVNFNGALTGTDLYDVDLGMINPGNAADFYVNLHNAAFGGGAIRGQLEFVGTAIPPVPEPASYALLMAGLGIVAFTASRRRG